MVNAKSSPTPKESNASTQGVIICMIPQTVEEAANAAKQALFVCKLFQMPGRPRAHNDYALISAPPD
jgi:hypothetical protein